MADAPPSTAPASGPVMQLLSRALQHWIRQQCDAVESLDLHLNGSGLDLLRGRLAGVTLMARRVVFRALEIEMVELQSGAISVHRGNLFQGQPLELQHPFSIRGHVAFTAAGLSRSLCTPHWRGLADHLADGLLGVTPLQDLRIERDTLVVVAQGIDQQRLSLETRPKAVDGTLEIESLGGNLRVRLPGDPNIAIEEANLDGGLLQLHGEARVAP